MAGLTPPSGKTLLLLLLPLVGFALAVLPGREGEGFRKELQAAHRAFADGLYPAAAAGFERSLRLRPEDPRSLYGLGIALMKMGRDEDAMDVLDRAVVGLREDSGGGEIAEPQRTLAVVLANRGLLLDRLGRHREALADYRRALDLDAAVAKGPGWITRFLRNQPKRPPGLRERADYLQEQLALPEGERLLLHPELDGRQRPYKL